MSCAQWMAPVGDNGSLEYDVRLESMVLEEPDVNVGEASGGSGAGGGRSPPMSGMLFVDVGDATYGSPGLAGLGRGVLGPRKPSATLPQKGGKTPDLSSWVREQVVCSFLGHR